MKTKIEIPEIGYIEIQKYFINEIQKFINNDIIEIITNGNLAAIMQDTIGYKLPTNKITLEKDSTGKAKKYSLGTFLEKPLLVDPYMRWDDNRILFKYNNDNIDELEIIDKNMLLL